MVEGRTGQQLLTLRAAADRLNVHPATLRRWADNGDILVMVTPGGHRRFPISEIERIAGERELDDTSEEVGAHLVEVAMSRAREGIAEHPNRAWIRELNEGERAHMRAMGRHVMTLLEKFVAMHNDEAELIAEAESMGREYADSTKEVGMALPDVLQAVTFFRDSILDAAVSLPEAQRMDGEGRRRLLRRINSFLNTILLSVAKDFEA